MTFADLKAAAAKLGTQYNTLGYRVDALLDSARVNADDTVYLEKAAPESDYDRIALDTVMMELSYCTDKAVIRWFAKRGINP